MLCSVGIFVSLLACLTGQAACSHKIEQVVDSTVESFKPTLNPIVGLDDLTLGWEWRHWLVFHNQVNLTCLLGSVYPLEKLSRAEEPSVAATSSGYTLLNVKLSSSGLGFRFDSCVLQVKDSQQARPIWGNLPDNSFDLEMKMAITPERCEGTVSKLGIQSPTITFAPDNDILKELENHGNLAELTEAIASNIQKSVNHELSKYIGQQLAFSLNLCTW